MIARPLVRPLVSPLVRPLTGSAGAGSIEGFAFPGETLRMLDGATSYQWFVNSDNRGTAQTLLLTIDDIGKTVTGIRNGITLPQKTVWKPQDVPGVQAFWWARAGVLSGVSPDVTAADGAGVRRWVGQVSGGPADQITGGNQPRFRSTGQSSGPSIEFDGTDDRLALSGSQLAIFNSKTHGYIFFGGRDTNPTGGTTNHCPIAFLTGTTGTRLGVFTRTGGNNFAAVARRMDGGTGAVASVASDNAYHVLTAEALWGAGSVNLRRDGTQVATAAFASGGGSTPATNSVDAAIGDSLSTSTTNPFPGHSCVFICANQELSATDRSRIERFIGLHGGLSIPLV